MSTRVLLEDWKYKSAVAGSLGEYQSQAFEEKVALVAGKGCLATMYVVNANASTRYLWVFDSASAAGTILAGPFVLVSQGYVSLDEEHGIPYETGIYIASSTTLTTYTASTTADLSIFARWGVSQT